jgi:hypothetical protein
LLAICGIWPRKKKDILSTFGMSAGGKLIGEIWRKFVRDGRLGKEGGATDVCGEY